MLIRTNKPAVPAPAGPSRGHDAGDGGEAPAALTALGAVDVQALAQGLGLLVHNTVHRHWFSATDQHESVAAFYALFVGCLTRTDEVVFRTAGGMLTVNGEAPKEMDRAMTTLVEQFQALRVGNVALRRGVTIDELERFVGVLATPAANVGEGDDFSAALAAQGVSHVGFRTVMYRELSDDDVVVSRRALESVAEPAGSTGPVVPVSDAQLATLLTGTDRGANTAGAAVNPANEELLSRLAEDTQRLAAVVLQVARTRPADEGSLTQALVHALNRAYDLWSRQDGAQTQTGKKRTQRNLRALEREVIGMLDSLPPQEQKVAAEAVRGTVGELEDDLRVDVLAAEYLKRLKAMEQTEKRLTRYLEHRGTEGAAPSELAERLSEGGLTPERWAKLVGSAERGRGAGPGPGPGGGGTGSGGGIPGSGEGGGVIDVGGLQTLLASLEQTARETSAGAGSSAGDELDRLLGSVQSEMRSIMDRTAGRIRFLTDELQVDESAVAALEDAARAQGQAVRITRRQLLEMLAEIAQELCQPLSVVQCSLDMVSSRMLGEVSDSQMEMLKLALESVTRLQGLVEGLRTVAGVPQSLTPDPGVLDRMAGKAKPGARA
jgi:hypothetical protein